MNKKPPFSMKDIEDNGRALAQEMGIEFLPFDWKRYFKNTLQLFFLGYFTIIASLCSYFVEIGKPQHISELFLSYLFLSPYIWLLPLSIAGVAAYFRIPIYKTHDKERE